MDILDVIYSRQGDATAIVYRDKKITYDQLRSAVSALSLKLADGFAMIVAESPVVSTIAWLACYHKGISCALIDPLVYGAESKSINAKLPYCQIVTDLSLSEESGAVVINFDADKIELVEWREPSSFRFDKFFVLATSRSTGELKFVRHDNRLLVFHNRFWRENFPLFDGDIVAAPGSLPFGYGFIVALTWALWFGAAIAFVHRDRESQLPSISHSCTVSALSVYDLRNIPKFENLRLAVSSGFMIQGDFWRWFAQSYPGVRLVNLVGATEFLTPFMYSDSERPDVFRIFSPYDARVVDPDCGHPVFNKAGYLELKGFFSPAYWMSEDQTARIRRDGWIRLGDFAVHFPDGSYKFLGRSSISFDVEGAILADRRFSDCCLVLIDGSLVLFIAASKDAESVDLSDVLSLLNKCDIKKISTIILLDKIERSPSGKIPYAWARRVFDCDGSQYRARVNL